MLTLLVVDVGLGAEGVGCHLSLLGCAHSPCTSLGPGGPRAHRGCAAFCSGLVFLSIGTRQGGNLAVNPYHYFHFILFGS